MEKTRQRGVYQADRNGVNREERRGERIEYQSDKSIVDWIKRSRLEKAARNEEIRVERIKKILKERN